ncbi:MAG: redoxin domain-containing protein [Actinobacteria bacterium]|nr:redoxin domain-containing protein [Actinomycetota bacterium]
MKGSLTNRYSLLVGLVFLVLIGIATLHTLSGGGEDILGLDEQPPRWPIPEFAVPAAAGRLEGDANIYQDDCGSSSLPCPESSQRLPACRITTAGAIRVCDLFGRPLVISFWFGTSNECEREQGVVSQVAERYRGRVNFLSLDSLDSRGSVRELVARHGWKMPVGFDRDGAVAALFKLAACPTFAYVYPGGTLQSAGIGYLGVGSLSQHVDELLSATRVAERG